MSELDEMLGGALPDTRPEVPPSEEVDLDREVGFSPEEYSPYTDPVPKGRYWVATHGIAKDGEGFTKNDQPWARKPAQVTKGDFKGRLLDIFLSTEPVRNRPQATSANDFFTAIQYAPYLEGRVKKIREYKQAYLEADGEVEVTVDWEATCRACKEAGVKPELRSVFGMTNFPKRQNGSYSPEVKCGNCNADLMGRAQVQRIIVPKKGTKVDQVPF